MRMIVLKDKIITIDMFNSKNINIIPVTIYSKTGRELVSAGLKREWYKTVFEFHKRIKQIINNLETTNKESE